MNAYLKEAFSWNLRWFFGSATTAFGTPFLAQIVAEKVFKKEIPTSWSILIGFIIIIIAIFARFAYIITIELGKLKTEVEAKSKELEAQIAKMPKPFVFNRSDPNYYIYGENVLLLKDAFSYIHGLRKDRPTREGIVDAMLFLCEKLKDMFEEAPNKETGKRYAVCIKLFSPDGASRKLYEDRDINVVFSDDVSQRQRAIHYSKPSTLSKDSCYDHSTRGVPNLLSFFYIKNDVVSDVSYKSAFFETYPMPSDVTTASQREAKWPLPYKSELVVPIYPLHSKSMPYDKKREVVGFICVDCDQKGGFNPRYDIGMLQGVADGIYDIITLLNNDRN